MNKKGQRYTIGAVLLLIFFIISIVAFATIEPIKETLDISRNTTSLNCPGTPGFNQALYDQDDAFNRSVKRPTCFVTGIAMLWFIGAVILATLAWVVSNWRLI